jgi:ELWxxDGT repeat protein
VTSAVLVEDLNPGSSGSQPFSFAPLGAKALFIACVTGSGCELFETSGDAANTQLLVELAPGAASGTGFPGPTPALGTVVFVGQTAASGTELFRSNGTAAGTVPLTNLAAAGAFRDFRDLTPLGSGRIAFGSGPDNSQREPFVVVDAGGGSFQTFALGELFPGTPGSAPGDFVEVGDDLFFVATDPTHGRELWVSGGTSATTALVVDLVPGPGSAGILDPVAFDGRLFFRACDDAGGCELWSSDGTAPGTSRVRDLEPGRRGSDPSGLVVVGDYLYFQACTSAVGCELFVSDGTAGGTVLHADLRPGPFSSNPGHETFGFDGDRFLPSGDFIYFPADGDGSGAELWAAVPVMFRDGFEAGDTSRWSSVTALDDSGESGRERDEDQFWSGPADGSSGWNGPADPKR